MRSLLSAYHITPHELREAAILAATMHETERIRPLFISPSPFGGMVFVDEAKDIPPAMFGGLHTLDNTNRTATGAMLGCETGRIQTSVPNFTEQDKQSVLDKFKCICGLSEHPNRTKHTHTCNDSNWVFYHPRVTPTPPQCGEHCHLFVGTGYGYSVCNDCGMSDVYYNWAYNKKPSTDTDGWRDPA